MRIAWIDHEIKHMDAFVRLLRAHDLEVFGEENLEGFEKQYGSLEGYDGLMWHPGIKDIFDDSERIREYALRKSTIVL